MLHKSGGRDKARSHHAPHLVERCAVIPVRMHGDDGLAWAREEFESLLAHQHHGILGTARHGDVLANLWFIRAAHEFAAAVAVDAGLTPEQRQDHQHLAGKSLLPVCKRAIQELISEKGMDGIWMDDSGVLAGLARRGRPNAALQTPLRLNALWYTALEVTGAALRGSTPLGQAAGHATTKDPAGDHFERLAGRFRRAFTKAYWCEAHQRICPPAQREPAAGPDHGSLPDAEQLLLMILPESPIPRTKQLGILTQIETGACGPLGVYVLDAHGQRVESLLHRAWLAQGLGLDAETEAQRQRAVAAARPLEAVRLLAQTSGVHAYYLDGQPVGKKVDAHTTAEVLGTLHRFLGA